MKLRKSKVSMAIATALGMAAATSTSFANQEKYSVDTIPPASVLLGTLNTSSGGDVLLFPFYTVVNGAITRFSVTNTSPNQTVVAKIRFREQVYSMDVLDFLVVFSPLDKFDFWVDDSGENDRPVMHWDDNTCIIGPPKDAKQVEFPERAEFVATDGQMKTGHLEVLGVVDLSKTKIDTNKDTNFDPWEPSLADYAKHANGMPDNCGELAKIFGDPKEVQKLNYDETVNGEKLFPPLSPKGGGTYHFLNDVANVLMGSYTVTIPTPGMEAGGDAIAIRDTQLANPIAKGGWDKRWRVTAQSGDECKKVERTGEANCRTAALYSWDKKEEGHPHLGELGFLEGFQRGLGARTVAGDWSNEVKEQGQSVIGVDWVLSFPSKYAYMDYTKDSSGELHWILLAHPKAQNWLGTPYRYSDNVWTHQDTDITSLDTELSVFGTEENETDLILNVSPSNSPDLTMPNEMNIFTLYNKATGGDSPVQSVIQSPGLRQTVTFDLSEAKKGWAKLDLMWPEVKTIGEYCDMEGDLPDYDIYGEQTNLLFKPIHTFNISKDGAGYVDQNGDEACDDRSSPPNGVDAGDKVTCTGLGSSPDLCNPPYDAVTGVIFTTRRSNQVSDATLTELQKNPGQ